MAILGSTFLSTRFLSLDCGTAKRSSGGYETEHSKVRNGRVFNLHLKDLKKNYPKVETWNSYEDKHIDDYVVLDKNYLQQYAKK